MIRQCTYNDEDMYDLNLKERGKKLYMPTVILGQRNHGFAFTKVNGTDPSHSL